MSVSGRHAFAADDWRPDSGDKKHGAGGPSGFSSVYASASTGARNYEMMVNQVLPEGLPQSHSKATMGSVKTFGGGSPMVGG